MGTVTAEKLSRSRRWRALAAAGILCAVTVSAAAETNIASKSDLRARQDALFAQILQDPTDVDANLAYARVAARLEDYEGAIATLERFLSSGSDSDPVRLELAAFYFKIASYRSALRYLDQITTTDPIIVDRAAEYRDEIERRTARNRFRGSASLGAIYSDNATLGASDYARGLSDLGFAGIALEVDPSAQPREDFGVRAAASLTHTYDFQTERTETWVTQLSGFVIRYENARRGDQMVFTGRTGPRLAVDDFRNGLKFRPFIEGTYQEAAHRMLYAAPGVGFELSEILGDKWYVAGEARAQYRDYGAPLGEEDGYNFRGQAGVAYAPARDLEFTLVAAYERHEAREEFARYGRAELRAGAELGYDPGFDFIDDLWVLSAHVGASHREFDDTDTGSPDLKKRRETEYFAGVSHRFALQDGFGFTVDAEYLKREASLGRYELDALTFGASVDYKF